MSAALIRTGAQAVDVARDLAARLAEEASARDLDRRLPHRELDAISDAGIFGLTVPSHLGGPDVTVPVLTEVFRLLAEADPSIAQIPHSHFVFLEALRLRGTEAQQARFFAEALAGRRFANAQSERAGRTITDDATTLTPDGRGGYVLDGEKFYATGSLFAHWLVVRAVLPHAPGEPPRKAVAYIPADAHGVTIEDDWDALGQRTTGSGTVRLTGVEVDAQAVVPYTEIFAVPTAYGSFAQVLHAALDAGIARAALNEAVKHVARARPWFESGADRAADDPLLVQQAGELEITVRAAEALLREAAVAVDAARSAPDEANTAHASIATAVAKVATARAAVDASSALFELAGTRGALAGLNLSRFWRDARTHTLHDPARWKVQHIGRHLLDGTAPPRHGLL
ncbi:SfnB family sulfur acquisition oxidoreductase [Actinocorallia sp. A-T 12471]|uniref:SfnB family sulfur acquisition oxidoreductase n=1 Tax=Actinocorallia sp. A-T 12471 TaxID=3089813 RepID=UPI0029D13851|nr:SfnB family sulfur acquisition oxidoreductase [Actinocorallia sp. A-T 12471]MDX6742321.1 SfnB family sulfur acquisition oxidoreductase [Actinocorallia sp. A-T 12471]